MNLKRGWRVGGCGASLRLAMPPFLAASSRPADARKKAGMACLEAHSTGGNRGASSVFHEIPRAAGPPQQTRRSAPLVLLRHVGRQHHEHGGVGRHAGFADHDLLTFLEIHVRADARRGGSAVAFDAA